MKMFNSTELKDSAGLLMELSEPQQETITGGNALDGLDYFFYQQTDIRSSANDDYQFRVPKGKKKKGNMIGSGSSNSDYSLSQTTLAFGSYPESSSQSGIGGIIGGILNLLFGGLF